MKNALVAAALGSAILWGIFHFMLNPAVSSDAKRLMPVIVAGLNKDLGAASPVCVYEGPFPLRVGGLSYRSCRSCEQLVEAGLIEKIFPKGDVNARYYDYALTASGRAVYTQETEPLSGQRRPRFCFGTARVGKVVEALPGKVIGGNTIISVKYTVDVLNPNSFLFTDKSAKLGIGILPAGQSTLPGTFLTTVLISYPEGRYNYQDGTMRYGKWLNEPSRK